MRYDDWINKWLYYTLALHDGITMASSLYPYHDDYPDCASPGVEQTSQPSPLAHQAPPIVTSYNTM